MFHFLYSFELPYLHAERQTKVQNKHLVFLLTNFLCFADNTENSGQLTGHVYHSCSCQWPRLHMKTSKTTRTNSFGVQQTDCLNSVIRKSLIMVASTCVFYLCDGEITIHADLCSKCSQSSSKYGSYSSLSTFFRCVIEIRVEQVRQEISDYQITSIIIT